MEPINVYVRRGDDRYGRTISFDLPYERPWEAPEKPSELSDELSDEPLDFSILSSPSKPLIPQSELLELGFAIDGKQAVCSIGRQLDEVQSSAQRVVWKYSYLDLKPRGVENGATQYQARWLLGAETLSDALLLTQRSLAAFLQARTGREVQFV
jgi:hypothetical protein